MSDPRPKWFEELSRRSRIAGRIVGSWFELTADEQRTVALLLSIFLLGLLVKIWHSAH